MPIICNNIIVVGEEKKTPPNKEEPKIVLSTSESKSWGSIQQEIQKTIVRNENTQPKIKENVDHYHHERHGDLHKLVNKKSDYLADMLALENNK